MKEYIITIIITAALLQLGGLIINKDSYKKLFQLTGGILLILALLKIPNNINFDSLLTNSEFDKQETVETFANKEIANVFTQKTSEMIMNDVESSFGINCTVSAETDSSFSRISITVKGDFEPERAKEISSYISQKYCSENDEVKIVYENN